MEFGNLELSLSVDSSQLDQDLNLIKSKIKELSDYSEKHLTYKVSIESRESVAILEKEIKLLELKEKRLESLAKTIKEQNSLIQGQGSNLSLEIDQDSINQFKSVVKEFQSAIKSLSNEIVSASKQAASLIKSAHTEVSSSSSSSSPSLSEPSSTPSSKSTKPKSSKVKVTTPKTVIQDVVVEQVVHTQAVVDTTATVESIKKAKQVIASEFDKLGYRYLTGVDKALATGSISSDVADAAKLKIRLLNQELTRLNKELAQLTSSVTTKSLPSIEIPVDFDITQAEEKKKQLQKQAEQLIEDAKKTGKLVNVAHTKKHSADLIEYSRTIRQQESLIKLEAQKLSQQIALYKQQQKELGSITVKAPKQPQPVELPDNFDLEKAEKKHQHQIKKRKNLETIAKDKRSDIKTIKAEVKAGELPDTVLKEQESYLEKVVKDLTNISDSTSTLWNQMLAYKAKVKQNQISALPAPIKQAVADLDIVRKELASLKQKGLDSQDKIKKSDLSEALKQQHLTALQLFRDQRTILIKTISDYQEQAGVLIDLSIKPKKEQGSSPQVELPSDFDVEKAKAKRKEKAEKKSELSNSPEKINASKTKTYSPEQIKRSKDIREEITTLASEISSLTKQINAYEAQKKQEDAVAVETKHPEIKESLKKLNDVREQIKKKGTKKAIKARTDITDTQKDVLLKEIDSLVEKRTQLIETIKRFQVDTGITVDASIKATKSTSAASSKKTSSKTARAKQPVEITEFPIKSDPANQTALEAEKKEVLKELKSRRDKKEGVGNLEDQIKKLKAEKGDAVKIKELENTLADVRGLLQKQKQLNILIATLTKQSTVPPVTSTEVTTPQVVAEVAKTSEQLVVNKEEINGIVKDTIEEINTEISGIVEDTTKEILSSLSSPVQTQVESLDDLAKTEKQIKSSDLVDYPEVKTSPVKKATNIATTEPKEIPIESDPSNKDALVKEKASVLKEIDNLKKQGKTIGNLEKIIASQSGKQAEEAQVTIDLIRGLRDKNSRLKSLIDSFDASSTSEQQLSKSNPPKTKKPDQSPPVVTINVTAEVVEEPKVKVTSVPTTQVPVKTTKQKSKKQSTKKESVESSTVTEVAEIPLPVIPESGEISDELLKEIKKAEMRTRSALGAKKSAWLSDYNTDADAGVRRYLQSSAKKGKEDENAKKAEDEIDEMNRLYEAWAKAKMLLAKATNEDVAISPTRQSFVPKKESDLTVVDIESKLNILEKVIKTIENQFNQLSPTLIETIESFQEVDKQFRKSFQPEDKPSDTEIFGPQALSSLKGFNASLEALKSELANREENKPVTLDELSSIRDIIQEATVVRTDLRGAAGKSLKDDESRLKTLTESREELINKTSVIQLIQTILTQAKIAKGKGEITKEEALAATSKSASLAKINISRIPQVKAIFDYLFREIGLAQKETAKLATKILLVETKTGKITQPNLQALYVSRDNANILAILRSDINTLLQISENLDINQIREIFTILAHEIRHFTDKQIERQLPVNLSSDERKDALKQIKSKIDLEPHSETEERLIHGRKRIYQEEGLSFREEQNAYLTEFRLTGFGFIDKLTESFIAMIQELKRQHEENVAKIPSPSRRLAEQSLGIQTARNKEIFDRYSSELKTIVDATPSLHTEPDVIIGSPRQKLGNTISRDNSRLEKLKKEVEDGRTLKTDKESRKLNKEKREEIDVLERRLKLLNKIYDQIKEIDDVGSSFELDVDKSLPDQLEQINQRIEEMNNEGVHSKSLAGLQDEDKKMDIEMARQEYKALEKMQSDIKKEIQRQADVEAKLTKAIKEQVGELTKQEAITEEIKTNTESTVKAETATPTASTPSPSAPTKQKKSAGDRSVYKLKDQSAMQRLSDLRIELESELESELASEDDGRTLKQLADRRGKSKKIPTEIEQAAINRVEFIKEQIKKFDRSLTAYNKGTRAEDVSDEIPSGPLSPLSPKWKPSSGGTSLSLQPVQQAKNLGKSIDLITQTLSYAIHDLEQAIGKDFVDLAHEMARIEQLYKGMVIDGHKTSLAYLKPENRFPEFNSPITEEIVKLIESATTLRTRSGRGEKIDPSEVSTLMSGFSDVSIKAISANHDQAKAQEELVHQKRLESIAQIIPQNQMNEIQASGATPSLQLNNLPIWKAVISYLEKITKTTLDPNRVRTMLVKTDVNPNTNSELKGFLSPKVKSPSVYATSVKSVEGLLSGNLKNVMSFLTIMIHELRHFADIESRPDNPKEGSNNPYTPKEQPQTKEEIDYLAPSKALYGTKWNQTEENAFLTMFRAEKSGLTEELAKVFIELQKVIGEEKVRLLMFGGKLDTESQRAVDIASRKALRQVQKFTEPPQKQKQRSGISGAGLFTKIIADQASQLQKELAKIHASLPSELLKINKLNNYYSSLFSSTQARKDESGHIQVINDDVNPAFIKVAEALDKMQRLFVESKNFDDSTNLVVESERIKTVLSETAAIITELRSGRLAKTLKTSRDEEIARHQERQKNISAEDRKFIDAVRAKGGAGQFDLNNLPQIKAIVKRLETELGVSFDKLKFRILDKGSSEAGVRGGLYSSKDNTVAISATLAKSLLGAKGTLEEQTRAVSDVFSTLLHEMRHAVDYDFGRDHTASKAIQTKSTPLTKEERLFLLQRKKEYKSAGLEMTPTEVNAQLAEFRATADGFIQQIARSFVIMRKQMGSSATKLMMFGVSPEQIRKTHQLAIEQQLKMQTGVSFALTPSGGGKKSKPAPTVTSPITGGNLVAIMSPEEKRKTKDLYISNLELKNELIKVRLLKEQESLRAKQLKQEAQIAQQQERQLKAQQAQQAVVQRQQKTSNKQQLIQGELNKLLAQKQRVAVLNAAYNTQKHIDPTLTLEKKLTQNSALNIISMIENQIKQAEKAIQTIKALKTRENGLVNEIIVAKAQADQTVKKIASFKNFPALQKNAIEKLKTQREVVNTLLQEEQLVKYQLTQYKQINEIESDIARLKQTKSDEEHTLRQELASNPKTKHLEQAPLEELQKIAKGNNKGITLVEDIRKQEPLLMAEIKRINSILKGSLGGWNPSIDGNFDQLRGKLVEYEEMLKMISESTQEAFNTVEQGAPEAQQSIDDVFGESGISGMFGRELFNRIQQIGNEIKNFFDQIVNNFINVSLEFERLRTTIETLEKGGFSFAISQAKQYNLELRAVAGTYKNIIAAANPLIETGALSIKDVHDLFDGVNTASRAFNLTADDTESVLRAISQMLSKGVVQAEELRGQLGERLPGAFEIAAKSIGMTTFELDQALRNGEVSATRFVKAFGQQLKLSTILIAAENMNTASAAISGLKNTITELQIAIGDALQPWIKSSVDILNASLKFLVNNSWLVLGAIQAIGITVTTLAIPSLLKLTTSVIPSLISGLIKLTALLKSTAAAMDAMAVKSGFQGIIPYFGNAQAGGLIGKVLGSKGGQDATNNVAASAAASAGASVVATNGSKVSGVVGTLSKSFGELFATIGASLSALAPVIGVITLALAALGTVIAGGKLIYYYTSSNALSQAKKDVKQLREEVEKLKMTYSQTNMDILEKEIAKQNEETVKEGYKKLGTLAKMGDFVTGLFGGTQWKDVFIKHQSEAFNYVYDEIQKNVKEVKDRVKVIGAEGYSDLTDEEKLGEYRGSIANLELQKRALSEKPVTTITEYNLQKQMVKAIDAEIVGIKKKVAELTTFGNTIEGVERRTKLAVARLKSAETIDKSKQEKMELEGLKTKESVELKKAEITQERVKMEYEAELKRQEDLKKLDWANQDDRLNAERDVQSRLLEMEGELAQAENDVQRARLEELKAGLEKVTQEYERANEKIVSQLEASMTRFNAQVLKLKASSSISDTGVSGMEAEARKQQAEENIKIEKEKLKQIQDLRQQANATYKGKELTDKLADLDKQEREANNKILSLNNEASQAKIDMRKAEKDLLSEQLDLEYKDEEMQIKKLIAMKTITQDEGDKRLRDLKIANIKKRIEAEEAFEGKSSGRLKELFTKKQLSQIEKMEFQSLQRRFGENTRYLGRIGVLEEKERNNTLTQIEVNELKWLKRRSDLHTTEWYNLQTEMLDVQLESEKAHQDKLARMRKKGKDARIRLLDEEKSHLESITKLNDLMTRSIERQIEVINLQEAVSKARSDASNQMTEAELTNTQRAIELIKKLKTGNLANPESILAVQELASLGYDAKAREVDLVKKLANLQTKQLNEKWVALQREQRVQKQLLGFELKKMEIAGRKEEIDAKTALLESKKAILEGQVALINAQKEESLARTEEEKSQARQSLYTANQQILLAKEGLNLTKQSLDFVSQNNIEQSKISQLKIEELETTQRTARQTLLQELYTKKYSDALENVKSLNEAINDTGETITQEVDRRVQLAQAWAEDTGKNPMTQDFLSQRGSRDSLGLYAEYGLGDKVRELREQYDKEDKQKQMKEDLTKRLTKRTAQQTGAGTGWNQAEWVTPQFNVPRLAPNEEATKMVGVAEQLQQEIDLGNATVEELKGIRSLLDTFKGTRPMMTLNNVFKNVATNITPEELNRLRSETLTALVTTLNGVATQWGV